jgi:hypothetical protein
MKPSSRKPGAIQIADVANGLIDPVLARRAGINTALLSSWPEIAGAQFADCTRPEKIAWQRREEAGDGGYQPGTLTVACEGSRALFLSHAQGELIARINSFFGFSAIRQIRIVQKPVAAQPQHRRLKPLDAVAASRLDDMVEGMEDGKLKEAILRLGRGVLSPSNRKKR